MTGPEVVHVVPSNDSVLHDHHGDQCPCDPGIELFEDALLYRHRSLDGREGRE